MMYISLLRDAIPNEFEKKEALVQNYCSILLQDLAVWPEFLEGILLAYPILK